MQAEHGGLADCVSVAALEERVTDLWDSSIEPIDLLAEPTEDVRFL
jgi:hypothetical protein